MLFSFTNGRHCRLKTKHTSSFRPTEVANIWRQSFISMVVNLSCDCRHNTMFQRISHCAVLMCTKRKHFARWTQKQFTAFKRRERSLPLRQDSRRRQFGRDLCIFWLFSEYLMSSSILITCPRPQANICTSQIKFRSILTISPFFAAKTLHVNVSAPSAPIFFQTSQGTSSSKPQNIRTRPCRPFAH